MDQLDYIQRVFEHLHKWPELSLQEKQTSSFLAKELQKLGFVVKTNLGDYGVMGIMEFSSNGPILALRADMDALPIQEETNVLYKSATPGVMHACGHDSHMAILLGTCAYVAQNRQSFTGTLLVVFQPAEEIVVGAKAMLEDDIFADYLPNRMIGIHNWPHLSSGSVGIQRGPITAFADRFKVVFHGRGGHGAFPHKTRDSIAMATAGIQQAFNAVQRRGDAAYPRELSFGVIKGGTSFNVIPEEVSAEGTVRTIRQQDQAEMIAILHKAFKAASSLYGGDYSLTYHKGVPAVCNDATVVGELTTMLKAKLPAIPLVNHGLASLIGEDMAYFLQEVPGVLLLLGSGEEGAVNELHNPRFIVPGKTLKTGYQVMVNIVESYLAKN